MQRNKGKRGEREAAKELSKYFGFEARRGVQYKGGPNSPDVVLENAAIHVEVKRDESTMSQRIFKRMCVKREFGIFCSEDGYALMFLNQNTPFYLATCVTGGYTLAGLKLTKAMKNAYRQSANDAPESSVPIVMTRRSNQGWVIYMKQSDLSKFSKICIAQIKSYQSTGLKVEQVTGCNHTTITDN